MSLLNSSAMERLSRVHSALPTRINVVCKTFLSLLHLQMVIVKILTMIMFGALADFSEMEGFCQLSLVTHSIICHLKLFWQ